MLLVNLDTTSKSPIVSDTAKSPELRTGRILLWKIQVAMKNFHR